LDGAAFYKRLLQRMQFPVQGEAFNGDHFLARDVFDRVLAGSNSLFINNDRACAALVLAAAKFRARESQVGAQNPKERPLAVCGYRDRAAVELEMNGLFHQVFLLSGFE
jgi:hypothetical protein